MYWKFLIIKFNFIKSSIDYLKFEFLQDLRNLVVKFGKNGNIIKLLLRTELTLECLRLMSLLQIELMISSEKSRLTATYIL